MSQREGTFRGGIQKGTMAWDNDSFELDKFLKESRDNLINQFSKLRMVKTFSKEDKLKYLGDDCFGFSPDGGAWFFEDELVAVFEAKKQGLGGNAYERWYDNFTTAKYINPKVKYVTFCTGKGAAPGQCLDKLRRKASIIFPDNVEFFMSETGFTYAEVYDIMTNILERTMHD